MIMSISWLSGKEYDLWEQETIKERDNHGNYREHPVSLSEKSITVLFILKSISNCSIVNYELLSSYGFLNA